MKVLLDSSTLYSAIAYDGNESDLLKAVIERHQPVISDYVLEELRRNFSRKLSGHRRDEVLPNWKPSPPPARSGRWPSTREISMKRGRL
ncbi:MAG: hypothetical protein MAG715_01005 [Methanonatronarchaeales archaeon]|nr:hypothetical protein [Methanonatronarchaeales archaeon]